MNPQSVIDIGLPVVFALAVLIGAIRYFRWERERPQLDDGPLFGGIHNWEVRVVHDKKAGKDNVGLVVTTSDVDGNKDRHYAILSAAEARVMAGWLRAGS